MAARNGSPCLGCKDRHPACHDGCAKYKAFVAEKDRVKKARADYYARSYGRPLFKV